MGLLLDRFFSATSSQVGFMVWNAVVAMQGHHLNQVVQPRLRLHVHAYLAHEAAADLQSDQMLHRRRPGSAGAEWVVV